MANYKQMLRFGLISLVVCSPVGSRAEAQELRQLGTARVACNVSDDELLGSLQTTINIAIVNENIDRRAKGLPELPRIDFEAYPVEATRGFLKRLRTERHSGIASEEAAVAIVCSDPAP